MRTAIICVMLCLMAANPGPGNTGSANQGGPVPPDKAYIVVSRQNWGCVTDQRIARDITAHVARPRKEPVTIEEKGEFDDLAVKEDIYLYFSAKAAHGLKGYFILRIRPERTAAVSKASLSIGEAWLSLSDGALSLHAKIRPEGAVNTALFYSRHAEPENGLFSCPGAPRATPGRTNRLRAYEFKVNPRAEVRDISGGWRDLTMPLNKYFRDQALEIDRCEQLFDALERRLSASSDTAFLWDRTRIDAGTIQEVMAAAGRETGGTYYLSVEISRKGRSESLWANHKGFVPKLRQQIVIKEKDGQLTGGEVLISPGQGLK